MTSARLKPTRVVTFPLLSLPFGASTSSITFETWMAASWVTIPPVVPARPPWFTTLVCRLMRFTPSTITRSCSDSTAMTLPSAPLSLPAMTRTRSPFLMFRFFLFAMSEHLRSERDDSHELLLTQLPADGAEDTGATRLAVGPKDDGGVLVEANVRAVGTTALLDGPDHNGLDDVTLLDVATGDRVLHGGDDDVADSGVAPTRAAENTDAEDLLRTGVVGDLESRLLLDHRFFSWLSRRFSPGLAGGRAWRNSSVGIRGSRPGVSYLAFSRTSTTRQRLVADSGRVSMIRTRSPTPHWFCSSCAFSLLVRRSTLP